VLSRGLVPPLGTLPSVFVSERCAAQAIAVLGGPAETSEVLEHGSPVVLATLDRGFRRQLADTLRAGGLDLSGTSDVTGVELAGCAQDAAMLAMGAAASAGPGVAGVAAGRVFAEVDALARMRGAGPETFAGLAGAGDVVAAMMAENSCSRRAGELLARGLPLDQIGALLGGGAEVVHSVPLLATVAMQERLQTPALDGLAALVEGRIEPERWTAIVTPPARPGLKQPVHAA
jgi:glycerol-3-phosphate dehydrogenase